MSDVLPPRQRPYIHEEVAALLDGDMDKARAVLAVVGRHIAEESIRIESENAPSLRRFGLHEEARARELAALFVRDWSRLLDLDYRGMEVRALVEKGSVLLDSGDPDQAEEALALFNRVQELLTEGSG